MSVPRSHEDAARKNRRGQQGLDDVHEQKRRAAVKDPQRDRNKDNADRVAKEWRKGGK